MTTTTDKINFHHPEKFLCAPSHTVVRTPGHKQQMISFLLLFRFPLLGFHRNIHFLTHGSAVTLLHCNISEPCSMTSLTAPFTSIYGISSLSALFVHFLIP